MGMGLEWAHAECLGQGQGLLVVRCGGCDVRQVTVHGNLPEEPQGPRLIAPHFVVAGVLKLTLGQPVRLLHLPGEEIGLPTEDAGPLNLSQHGEGVRRAVSQGIGQRQIRGASR